MRVVLVAKLCGAPPVCEPLYSDVQESIQRAKDNLCEFGEIVEERLEITGEPV